LSADSSLEDVFVALTSRGASGASEPAAAEPEEPA
jgi:hypothetical protein